MLAISTNLIPFYKKNEYSHEVILRTPKSFYQTGEPGTITAYRTQERETITTGSFSGFETIESDEIGGYAQGIGALRAEMISETLQSIYETTAHLTNFSFPFKLMDSWLDSIEAVQYNSTKAIDSRLQEALVGIVDNSALPTPKPIKEAINIALENGYHTTAVDLATKGLALFPEDAELQKVVKVLAPPKIIRTNIPPNKGLGQSIKWLKENRQQYQGVWVAVQNGVLLGHAPSREELAAVLGGVDFAKVLITRIPELFT